MFFVMFFLLVLALFIVYKKRYRHMTTFKKLGISGPKPNFIFGNIIEIASEGVHNVFPKWTKKYGSIVGFYFGGRPQVLISDLDLIRQIMIKDFHLFSDRNQIVPGGIHPQPQLQNTIGWARGNLWKRLRSTMSPSFSISKLKAMEPLMISSIDNMLIELDDKAKDGLQFNLKPMCEELTFATATKCIMGIHLSLYRMTEKTRSLVNTLRPRFEKSILLAVMVLFPSLTCIAYPLRVWWEMIRFKMLWSPEGIGFDVVRRSVRVRKAAEKKPNDVMQLLIDSNQIEPTIESDLRKVPDGMINDSEPSDNGELSEEMITANVNMLLLGAFETVALTLQFIIHNLIHNQDVQEELRNSLKAIAVNDGTFNINTLSEVPLLNHVIKETLRMYPPGTLGFSRVSEYDYEYQGYRIPKGTGVFVDVFSIHYNPELWPEPDKFQPKRFEKEFNKMAYFPFGIGPRNCLGMQFAYTKLQLTLASLFFQYKFEPGPSTEETIELLKASTALTPKNGVFCKVSRV